MDFSPFFGSSPIHTTFFFVSFFFPFSVFAVSRSDSLFLVSSPTLKASTFPMGVLVSALEWTTLLCSHAEFRGEWKSSLSSSSLTSPAVVPSSTTVVDSKVTTNEKDAHTCVASSDDNSSHTGGACLEASKSVRHPTVIQSSADSQMENGTRHPRWVAKCFHNEFRNPFGIFAILGKHFDAKFFDSQSG